MVLKMRTLSLPIPRTKEDLLVIHGCPLKTFSFRDLKLATDSFSKKNIVGRGGFGCVYRGRLADGSLVAIKRLNKERNPGGELQFQTEVDIGGSPASNNRNVLRLLGYCMTRTERILVYPFIANKCVASWLGERDPSESPLDWSTRKRIALGAAKGLAHLHYGSSFTVIHRDIKPENILLDEQFEAILCDFGLAKFVGRNGNESNSAWVQRPREEHYDDQDLSGEEDESDEENKCFTKSCWNFTRAEDGESRSRMCTKWSCWVFTKNEVISENKHGTVENGQPTYHEFCSHVTTVVRGTFGYVDPDYYYSQQCSVKSDVYGYGVTLLELVTGQRVYDPARLENNKHVQLRDWVKGLLEDHKMDLLVDSDIRGDCIQEELQQLIRLALSCTDDDPKKRPVMTEVIKIIENIGKPPPADQDKFFGDLSLQTFSLQQLKVATHDFNNKNIMGKSGYCYVYKGLLKCGSAVVVKRLVKTSKRARMQFEGEVKLGGIISGRHPNLLQLRGHCISGKESLLVYPFMPNQSLEWQLRPEHSLALDWYVRKQIAFGVAEGIDYLHYDCDSSVTIRCDIKPSNILLDGNFNPVISNLRLQSDGSSHVDVAANDVYGYGITLFVLISGKVSVSFKESGLHDVFKKLRHHQMELLVDPRLNVCDGNYDIKDEIDQLIQVALLCTQPSPTYRPEMWEVMQMLQGISEGDLKSCFAFDRANLFRFDESLQPQLFHEVELGAIMELPKLETEGSISAEFDLTSSSHLPVSPKQKSSASSKDKEIATFSVKPAYSSKSRPQSKGITISDNVQEPNMQERWKTFLSEVVSDALPTHSKLFQSGKSVDPLCPMCNEYEEDNFHLFFKCDFSRQAWLLAVGLRIDMLGFGSVKEAVDAILKPNDARFNILPPDVEPSRFSHKGVALMPAIWTHRNQVCFDSVSPNVIQMLKDHPDATNLYDIEPLTVAAQSTNECTIQTQEQFEEDETGWVTFDTDGCECIASDPTNWVQFESSHEMGAVQPPLEPEVLQEVNEPFVDNKPKVTLDAADHANSVQCESNHEAEPARAQPQARFLPQVLTAGINNNPQHDFQLNITTSGGFSLSLNCNNLSVWCVILLITMFLNLVSTWVWDKPRY